MDPTSSPTSQIQMLPLPRTTTTHSTNRHRSTKQGNTILTLPRRNPTMVKPRVLWRHHLTQAAIKARNNYTTKMVCSERNQYNLTIQLTVRRCTWLTPEPKKLGDDSPTNQFDEYDDSSRNEERDEASNYDTT